MRTVAMMRKASLFFGMLIMYGLQTDAQTINANEAPKVIKHPVMSPGYKISGASVTVYTFTGVGNWSDKTNWKGGLVPPSVLSANDKVIINGTGPCFFDRATIQQVLKGAHIEVALVDKGNISVSEIFRQQGVNETTPFAIVGNGSSKQLSSASNKPNSTINPSTKKVLKKGMPVVVETATE